MGQRSRLFIGALIIALVGSSCSGLAFRRDDRVQILEPDDGAAVTLPVTVRWRAEEIELAEPGSTDGVYFGIFVDRRPLRPGKSLNSLVGDDCRADGGCDQAYFADRGIYFTHETALVIDTLQPGRTHQLTIVLIDQQYRRVGEAAWTAEFRRADET